MDAERLKHGGNLTDEFFERQLEKIREIRLSERKFYQKITDIYITALDYDPSATATKRFFAAAQNKIHYAVHGQTAAEMIVDRADHQQENMGLTSWEGAPQGKIHRYDVSIAKNYLSEFELGQMQRIVSAYLDMAEMQAMRKIPMTMEDWEKRLSGFLQLWDRKILQDAGLENIEMIYSNPVLAIASWKRGPLPHCNPSDKLHDPKRKPKPTTGVALAARPSEEPDSVILHAGICERSVG